MTAIADLPDIRPSLLLDFANSGRVDPRIECTRASSATCWGPDGKLRTVPANTPRIDYDPVTGRCLGLLVEEARANQYRFSSDFSGAAWVKRSGLAAEVGTDMSPDGATYASTLYDNAAQSGGLYVTQTSHVMADATDYTASIFFKNPSALVTGVSVIAYMKTSVNDSVEATFTTSNGTVNLVNRGAAVAKAGGVIDVGNGWRRLWVSFNSLTGTSNIGVRFQMLFPVTTAGDGSTRVSLWGAQLEVGAFPTSYIPTGASAVTRAADVPVLQEQLMSAFGTMLVKYRNAGWTYTNTKPVGSLDLSRQIDTGVQINDHIERAMLYPRQLTAAQLQRLTA